MNEPINLPPANIEAEEAILGGILLDPQAISRIEAELNPQAFYVLAFLIAGPHKSEGAVGDGASAA